MPSPSPQAGAYFKCHTVRAQLKVILVRDPDGANLSKYTKYYHINWTRCILNSKYQNHTTNIKAISNIFHNIFQKKIICLWVPINQKIFLPFATWLGLAMIAFLNKHVKSENSVGHVSSTNCG